MPSIAHSLINILMGRWSTGRRIALGKYPGKCRGCLGEMSRQICCRPAKQTLHSHLLIRLIMWFFLTWTLLLPIRRLQWTILGWSPWLGWLLLRSWRCTSYWRPQSCLRCTRGTFHQADTCWICPSRPAHRRSTGKYQISATQSKSVVL